MKENNLPYLFNSAGTIVETQPYATQHGLVMTPKYNPQL